MNRVPISRRDALKRGVAGAAGLGAVGKLLSATDQTAVVNAALHANTTVGDTLAAGIDPHAYLAEFDYGKVSTLPDGNTLRDFSVVAVERELEVAPGIYYPAWAYNGRVPGPTIRATEGDVVRVRFHNSGQHHHTMHFHGFHAARMDGAFEQVPPGGEFTYEFTAAPAGLHLYHCHTMPLRRHVAKGLYGVFIVDSKSPRQPANEMVMVMNGFDINFDGENEIYAVNTVPFAYQHRPIRIQRGERQRVYLVNALEFDLVNSFHLHGNLFDVYRTGTRQDPDEFTDTLMMCQGERHILEFSYQEEGRFMFHAHQSEFAELGWTGIFEVVGAVA